MRFELQYARWRRNLFSELESRRDEIQLLVASHCGLNSDLVHVSNIFSPDNKQAWLHGSFNVCIPVNISEPHPSLPAKLAFRVPLPYKLGKLAYPGNVEEKLRSEAATYVWIDENCPELPIPKLHGFGLAGGLSVSANNHGHSCEIPR